MINIFKTVDLNVYIWIVQNVSNIFDCSTLEVGENDLERKFIPNVHFIKTYLTFFIVSF